MTAYRALLSFALLAGGMAGGYAFLNPFEHALVPRIAFQDVAPPAPLLYPAPSPSLSFRTKALESEKNSAELRPGFQTTPPMSADAKGLALDLQNELARVGCYAGAAHGNWDQRSKNAMKAFLDRVNARLPVDKPDWALLALTRHTPGSVCAGDRPPAVAELAATAPSASEATARATLQNRAPGAMGLGGPIMVPVGTISEGEEGTHAQTVTVVAPATAPELAGNTSVSAHPRSASRWNPQYEHRDPFRHPLGF
jgi:hypothetical protein